MTATSTTSDLPTAPRRPCTRRQRLRRLAVVLTTMLLAWTLVYELSLRDRLASWGGTEAEASATMPGDGLIPNPLTQITRAVSARATPRQVWPWLAQYGVARGAFTATTGSRS